MITRITGGRGDIIFSCAFLPFYGNDNTIIMTKDKMVTPGWVGTKFSGPEITEEDIDQFKDFLIKQVYITDVAKNGIWDIDLDNFRDNFPLMNGSILGAIAATYKIPDPNWRVSTNGWIDPAKYKKMNHGKDIIINKSLRYHSGNFDYTLLKDYNCGFIGLEKEYETFCRNYFKCDYIETKTITELARAVYSSKLFVGNESFANALAEAAAHPRILEVFGKSCPPYTYNGNTEISHDIVKRHIND